MGGKARVRMHGGASTGPRTAAGLARIMKARTIHGGRSAEMKALRRAFAKERRLTRGLLRWAEE